MNSSDTMRLVAEVIPPAVPWLAVLLLVLGAAVMVAIVSRHSNTK